MINASYMCNYFRDCIKHFFIYLVVFYKIINQYKRKIYFYIFLRIINNKLENFNIYSFNINK